MQKTIAKPFTIKGIGLHSGRDFQAVISPAPCNTGIQFRRDDVRHCDYTRITPYNVYGFFPLISRKHTKLGEVDPGPVGIDEQDHSSLS